ncbi:TetR/AcrR family transcriptional regulator [Leptospira interrogans]
MLASRNLREIIADMPRVSRKQAEQHHNDILEAAARLFREHGIDGVSLPGVMAEAGLTHGAFYGHFASKDALAAEACNLTFEECRRRYDELREKHGADRNAMRREFVTLYTSKPHRDNPGVGCPAPTLGADIARKSDCAEVRETFATGFDELINEMASFMSRPRSSARREETLASIAMLAGGILLARATAGHPISEEILDSVRHALIGRTPDTRR